MMKNKFEYLKQFLSPHSEFDGTSRNRFTLVKREELTKHNQTAKELGFQFPAELIEFYQEIGCGFLCAPCDVQDGYQSKVVNLLLHPEISVGLYKPFDNDGRLEEAEFYIEVEGYYISRETYEFLEPGDLPFFEISNSQFLVLRPNSGNPNAVWSDKGLKIEDSFEKFIWRLYYESPTFYDEIIEAHYKALKENS